MSTPNFMDNHVATFLDYYNEGHVVLTPYGLGVVTSLYDDPFRQRPEKEGDDEWPEGQENGPNFVAATVFINGHGEETMEIDQMVPATPTTMALDNYLGREVASALDTHLERIEDSIEDLVIQNSLIHDTELHDERQQGKRRRRQK